MGAPEGIVVGPRALTDAAFGEDGLLRALRPRLPYPLPPAGSPLRIVFVGQRSFFEACALQDSTPDLEPGFVDYRSGEDTTAMQRELAELRPHVVVAFRPEWYPPGVFDRVDAPIVGFVTEPLPLEGDEAHPDLERRARDFALVHPSNFDRIVSFDPRLLRTVERWARPWRALPLPVSDRLYAEVGALRRPLRAGFVGRSTEHRESFLGPLKHHFELLHVAHGVFGERLESFLADIDVAINLHNEPYPTFENRVAIHLAHGHLVVSEPLTPPHGLDPGLDFVEVRTPDEAFDVMSRIARTPAAFAHVRTRGRGKAEYFRASRSYRRLVHDLLLDVSSFGSRLDGSAAPRRAAG